MCGVRPNYPNFSRFPRSSLFWKFPPISELCLRRRLERLPASIELHATHALPAKVPVAQLHQSQDDETETRLGDGSAGCTVMAHARGQGLVGSGWWGAPHSCAGRGAWSAQATQSSETAGRSMASQCGRADAHRGSGGRRRTSSAASVFMPSVRYGQLAGFTFALQNGLFLWFGQWNLRERWVGWAVRGGQGGWARRCGVGCVLVDDDVHPLHEPTCKGGALLVAVEQELLEVAPIIISEHLRKQVSTCLLTHYLLTAH